MIKTLQSLTIALIQASVLGFLLLAMLPSVSAYAADYQMLGDALGTNTHPHNLSSAGASAVKADASTGETDQICIFCHTPHNASKNGPLWNRPDITTAVGGGSFPLYANLAALVIDDIPLLSTYGDTVTQYPNGATRLCLSCHDGVTAIGTVLSSVEGTNIAPSLSSMTIVSPSKVIDLSTSHPVSFVYSADVITVLQDKPTPGTNEYQAPPTAGILDDQQRVQCTACHDPHMDTNNESDYFLPMWRHYTGVEADDYENTCKECHISGSTSTGLTNPSPGALHGLP